MLEKVKRRLLGWPDYTASIGGSGLIDRVETTYAGGERPIRLKFKFTEIIADENKITHINVRDTESGGIIHQWAVKPGEKGFSVTVDIETPSEFGLVAVDGDGRIYSDQQLRVESGP